MKPTVFDCDKSTFPKQLNKVHLLLCTASVSLFWVVAFSDTCLAQVNPSNDFQLGLRGLLPLPQSSSIPSNQSQPRLQPPPASARATSPRTVFKSQQTPIEQINQLENAFIQQQGSEKTPKAKPRSTALTPGKQRQTNLPVLAAGEDNNFNNSRSNSPLPLPDAQNTQEFTAPGAPTFNQGQNPQIAPLPPLPGTPSPQVAPDATPTFNQLLSPQTQGTTGATFSQGQNPQIAPLPPLPGTPSPQVAPDATSNFNQQLTPQTQSTTGATFNPILNSQAVPPLVPPTTPRQEIPPSLLAPTLQTTPRSLNERANNRPSPLLNSTALREPSLYLEGVYVTQGGDSSARARVSGIYPLTPQALFGATLDLTSQNNTFDDSRSEGLSVNELYFATSLGGLPNLRFVVGQLDLTSYFDRNSFAKDGASQFFNPVFQTNPALSATGIASRTGLLVNWSVNDYIEAKGAVFSSSDRLSDFSLDGFAGEIGIRYGNAIIRGTYATDRDAGIRDTFPESFSLARNSDRTIFGIQEGDREEAYGINAEVFIPNIKLGVFGRYGKYENRDLGRGADTYVFGASLLDLFTRDDRLGLAYGRGLSNDSLRRGDALDVLEAYYDFKFLPNLRLGFTVQGRDNFEETVFGIRVKTYFDVTPRGTAR
ncbi:porin [Scytonema hofmannii FACHB-248]|uniref:Porin n=1 Tax=Scytonema hofmannii FACHB-248 TaxID=1842502 RepID=A0ABR8GX70_9CYAN|nr:MULTISPECIES: hypothetical protein [Nostocales]MBD2607655.1 porin [Scytonema hofmannii FACHB-248]